MELLKKKISVSEVKVEAIDNSLVSFGLEINDTELYQDVGYNKNQVQGIINTIPKPSSCKSLTIRDAKEDIIEEYVCLIFVIITARNEHPTPFANKRIFYYEKVIN